MNTEGIHLSWIVVKDLEAAITFYTEVVGLRLKEKASEYGWAELSGPSGSLLGIAQENPREPQKAGTNAVVTVTVKDITKAREDFLNKGARLIGDILVIPGHVKMQTFADADGNVMQLAEVLN